MAEALDVPSPTSSSTRAMPGQRRALPDYMPDTDEQARAEAALPRVVAARTRTSPARRTDASPARIGCGWGESTIGVYRRDARGTRRAREVPDHPIDASVGVIRVDDLAATRSPSPSLPPRGHDVLSAVVSSDFPGVARAVAEASPAGSLFLQGGGGNVNPRAGMGFEVDCRDTKRRVGLELGGEVRAVAAGIRTNTPPW